MFAQAAVEYEDYRVSDWAAEKPTAPFGTLPYLEVDGKRVSGSTVAARLVAEKHGLAGKNDVENAAMAGVMDAVADYQTKFFECLFEKDEAKKAEKTKDLNEKHTPLILGKLNDMVAGKFLYGDSPTWVDLGAYLVFNDVAKDDNIQKTYGKFCGVLKEEENLPNIKAWMEKRPKTDMDI